MPRRTFLAGAEALFSSTQQTLRARVCARTHATPGWPIPGATAPSLILTPMP